MSLLNILNIQRTAITAVLISLSLNSNICFSFGLVSIYNFFFPHDGCIFLLLCFPGNFFYCIPDIGYFSLLSGFKKIIIPVSILDLCLGMQLSYLETVWFFQVIPLRFVRQDHSNIEVRTNFTPLLRQGLSELSTQGPMKYKIFQSVWWEKAYVSTWYCSL